MFRVARLGKRAFSEAAGGKLSLSVTAPHEAICFQEAVDSVTLPGASGEYGVTVGHSPMVEELKPGVVSIFRGTDVEKYFVSGGFAFTDPTKTDVSVTEAIKLEDFDADKVKAEYAKAKAALDGATDDTKAEATIAHDTLKSISLALGIAL
mmetsp:Transcript_15649/g.51210  ORF Transcript_15649/g.51210 Transcript_15649/m.51210 type:complete len:151 (-) Transcript_15649:802-1254(-)